MNSIWFPVPVALFLRRVVNVLSTLSIAHHYLPRDRISATGQEGRGGRPWRKDDESGWRLALASAGANNGVDYSAGISIPWPRWRWPSSPNFAFFGQYTARRDAEKSQTQPRSSEKASGDRPPPPPPEEDPVPNDTIHRLIRSPVLYNPLLPPRFPIVLCHGLYGFDVRGTSAFRIEYWANVLNILSKTIGAEVIMTSVPGTGSIAQRAQRLDRFLKTRAHGRGVNLMAHSMGGLDGRHLITHIQPTEYTPLSLTTIATPHRGSPFMDWCMENLGLGRADSGLSKNKEKNKEKAKEKEERIVQAARDVASDRARTSSSSSSLAMTLATLPSSFTTLLLSMFDSPAYANLTTTYLNAVFNASTPDDPRVKYFSVGGRLSGMNVWHPLWLPKMVVDSAEEKERERLKKQSQASAGDGDEEKGGPWGNDGLVTVQSARWGEYLGTMEGCDHWQMRGASKLELGGDLTSLGDGWSFGDWGRYVRLLGRMERRREREKEKKEEEKTEGQPASVVNSKSASDKHADAVLKASTDKLSAVVDWLVEQVPTDSLSMPSLSSSRATTPANDAKVEAKLPPPKTQKRKGDLATSGDLERFYVALARKLYDEGL